MRRLTQASIESGQRVDWTTEINYKFKLSEFQQPLLAWLEACPDAIQPRAMYDMVKAEIESGLSDLSVSRPRSRLHWGVPVPGDEAHTMYVWVDALVNYLTAVGYPHDAPAWPADAHVVGKDIVRFHAIYWPAMLMAVGAPLPRTIVAHAHWTVNRAKMSKSKGNSVSPVDAIATYGLDTVRYYLMRIGGQLGTDADYASSLLEEHQRKFLQGQLGNLLSRVLAPKIQARLAGAATTLERPAAWRAEDQPLVGALEALPATVDGHMAAWEPSKALQAVFDVIAHTNEHVQRTAPWTADASVEAIQRTVYLACESLRITGVLLAPVMPQSMTRLLDTLQVPSDARTWRCLRLRASVPLHTSNTKIAPLFPRAARAS